MATTQRDYYEVLGVDRTAAEREIKKSFRRLARELHPDVSDAPDAETRFREAAEAYEVLSKPETRELYDRYGHAGLRSGGFQPGHFDVGNLSDLLSAFFGDDIFGAATGGRRGRGADVAAELELDLRDAARGVKRDVRYSASAACTRCSGDGVEPGSSPVTCPTCDGAGRLQQVSRSIFGDLVRAQVCPRCAGRGQVVEHPCTACRGEGRVPEEHVLEVDVPPGIHDGQRIRISGEGHVGQLGGHPGDVYVLIRVRSDERLLRDGNDIVSTVELTITQAALGARVPAVTLEGETELEFDPGTQPGEVRVLRGRGMPVLQGFGRGDHRVLVNVAVPRRLTQEQRDLLEQFEASAHDGNYRPDEGFFEKLKSAFR